MKYYFQTLGKVIRRILKDNGVPLLLGIMLFFIMMTLLTWITLRYPLYVPYFVIYLAVMGLFSISGATRVDFLAQQFGKKVGRRIRWIENFIITIPWLFIAVFITNWYLLLFLLFLVFMMAFVVPKNTKRSLPTPFSRSPFEFILFFRRSYVYVLLVASVLIGIACYFGNFNLGLVCLVVTLLTAMSAQDFREPDFFVWSYDLGPSGFLRLKMQRTFFQLLILVAPLSLLLLSVFPAHFILVLLCLLVGLLLNVMCVLMKYAIFPRIFSMPDVIKLLFGVMFPLILPFIVYQYYQKAQRNLLTWL